MMKLRFERAVETAVNMTILKEHVWQFHSPGGATVGASSSDSPPNSVGAVPYTGQRLRKTGSARSKTTMSALWWQACTTDMQMLIQNIFSLRQDGAHRHD